MLKKDSLGYKTIECLNLGGMMVTIWAAAKLRIQVYEKLGGFIICFQSAQAQTFQNIL